MIYLLSLLLFWLACGFVAAGWTFAYYHAQYGTRERLFAWLILPLGFASVVEALSSRRYRHGWRKWW